MKHFPGVKELNSFHVLYQIACNYGMEQTACMYRLMCSFVEQKTSKLPMNEAFLQIVLFFSFENISMHNMVNMIYRFKKNVNYQLNILMEIYK